MGNIRTVAIEFGTTDTPEGRVFTVTETVVTISTDGIPTSAKVTEIVSGITPDEKEK